MKKELVVLALIGSSIIGAGYAIPAFVYPRVMRTVSSPSGLHVAEVTVRPWSGAGYFGRLFSLATTASPDIFARVRDARSGDIVAEQLLTPFDDGEGNALGATIEWKGDTVVEFRSRHGELVVLSTGTTQRDGASAANSARPTAPPN